MNKPIEIWDFYSAPKEYKSMFDDDDADWLAVIPKRYLKSYIGFLEEGTSFGCCCVDKKKIKDGEIWVGRHA